MGQPSEITKTGDTVKRRFDARDWDHVAEYVVEEHRKRKNNRKDTEKQWDEIDRQLRMEPDLRFKRDKNNQEIPSKAWMSEMELPLQAQTLEVLTADARRMMFPPNKKWFTAHAAMEDEFLRKNEGRSLLVGDESEKPSLVTQDNIDKFVEGYLESLHYQYDLASVVDRINAESFKYSMGVGRVKMASKEMFIHTARGVVKETKKIPILVPRSIKSVYLDDSAHARMNEGMMIGPSTIVEWTQKHEDLLLAANKGGNDPKKESGGWMPAQVKRVDPDDKGNVTMYEFEGDLVVPRMTARSLYIPGAIVTVACGANSRVVRFRWRTMPFSSFVEFPYHHEHVDSPYCGSPLMKGRLIQLAATQALNMIMDSAALKIQPPIGYDKNDTAFTFNGPNVEPGALWESVDGIEVFDEVGGEPSALAQVYFDLVRQYQDETGVNSPRLGAETNSHTTAFAKQVENSRGQARTVDYVTSSLTGGLTRFLHMEYEMARKHFSGEEVLFLRPYRGFVRLDKDALPERVTFEVHGAGGPAEEQSKMQAKMAAVQFAIQIDQLKLQAGMQPTLDYAELQKQVLLDGGWTDIDPFINDATASVPAGTPESPGMAGTGVQSPGIATAALPAE